VLIRGRESSFRNFVQTSFMDGPLLCDQLTVLCLLFAVQCNDFSDILKYEFSYHTCYLIILLLVAGIERIN